MLPLPFPNRIPGQRRPFAAPRGTAAAGLALLLLFAGPVSAEILRYSLEIPDNQSVTYELDLRATHPGTLSVRANWSGKRIVSFRLEPPNAGGRAVRRSGPSPVELEAVAEAGQIGGPWKLVIHALAARGAGRGELTILVPEKPEFKPRASVNLPAPDAQPEVPPWLRAWDAPRNVSPEMNRLFRAVETLRSRVVAVETPDNCRWQEGLMQYFSSRRGQTPEISRSTRRLLRRIVDAVELVESYRNSRDPILAGPPPEDEGLRRVWVLERQTRFVDLEEVLDELLFAARGGYAPDLDGQTWPVRLVSCLTACERHFEEAGSLGEHRATNRELTRAQWDTIGAAADALEAYLAFGADPAIRALRR